MTDCPDRATFDRFKYTSQTGSVTAPRRVEPVAIGADYSCLDADECWDDVSQTIVFKVLNFNRIQIFVQSNAPTYDPQQYVQNANVIRTLNLAAPSQRAAFREEEIKRLNRLQNRQQ